VALELQSCDRIRALSVIRPDPFASSALRTTDTLASPAGVVGIAAYASIPG
jgi:hypothetical protein